MELLVDGNMLGWAVVALVMLLARALVAAFEAALVVVGLPRAQTLAAEANAGRRARALERLLSDPEPTSATGRILGLLLTLGGGALAVLAGLSLWGNTLPLFCAAGLPVLVFGLLALVFSSAGRALGSDHGEGIALALALPVLWIRYPLGLLGKALGTMAVILGRRGRFSMPRPPLDEMERCLAEYAKTTGGPSAQSTSELIRNVFEFREKVARDVMVPRTNIVAVEVDTPVPEIIRILAEEGHSRMPVFRESLDHVLGTLHARDFVPLLAHPELIVLSDLIRPSHFVPWSKPIDQLLREMQKCKLHMAIVVDEYGGVMGICTVEDVLEEIVGDIQDEFEDDGQAIEIHADGTFTMRGSTPVAEFNRVAEASLPEGKGYETIGGFLNALAGAIPSVGDRFIYRDWTFTIREATPRRVARVRAARVKRPAAG